MKLSKQALEAIKTKRCRMLLGAALNCVERTVIRYINDNDDSLTKAAAMKVIREETGLTDSEILVDGISRVAV